MLALYWVLLFAARLTITISIAMEDNQMTAKKVWEDLLASPVQQGDISPDIVNLLAEHVVLKDGGLIVEPWIWQTSALFLWL